MHGDTSPPSSEDFLSLSVGPQGKEGQGEGGCTAEARAPRRRARRGKAGGPEEPEFANSEEEESARAAGAQLLPTRRQGEGRGEGAGGSPPRGPNWRRPLGSALTGRTGAGREPTSEQAEEETPRASSAGGAAAEARRGEHHPPPGRPPGPEMAMPIAGPGVKGRRELEDEPSRGARTPGGGTQVSGRPPAAGDGHGSSRRR